VTAFEELSLWNGRLKARFPDRLVGELELSEQAFRELLLALRRFGEAKSLFTPPTLFPRIVLAVMTFTARYDYEGAFWSAFCENVGMDTVDRTAWGKTYRKGLRDFGLFTPPEHWMINVFPVLFHSIVPEASLEDFGIMCRAISDAFDVRLLDDHELANAIDSVDLPQLLRKFVAGSESKEVALELVRHIVEDLRLGLDGSDDTLRGRLLLVARAATETRTRQYGVQIQPRPWRYDFNTGRCGVWLASTRRFEEQPYRLVIGRYEYEVRSEKAPDGWLLLPQLLSLPFATEGDEGTLESYSEVLLRVRVARSPNKAPLIFRSIGDAGTYESAQTGPPGDYVIADHGLATIVDADGNTVDSAEELPTAQVSGVTSARLFALEEGSQVLREGTPIFVVQAATRPSVELRARSFWQLAGARNAVRVVSTTPTLDVRSPQSGAEFVVFEASAGRPSIKVPFNGRAHLRPSVPHATVCRSSVWIDGRPSGASGCDFIVLPFDTAISSLSGKQTMRVVGSGRLTIGSRVLALHEDQQAHIALNELLVDVEANYEVEGKAFALRYVGTRPIAWGFKKTALGTDPILLRADQLESHPCLMVAGGYGATVSLSVGGKAFATTSIGSNGFASIDLKNAVPLALSRGHIAMFLGSADGQFHVLDMYGVPQLRHEAVAYRGGTIVGQFALDGSVENLTLHAAPFHSPWLREELRTCNGSGRAWSIDAHLPDQRYSLFLTAITDGVPVTILAGGVPWGKECGIGSDTRSKLDVHLYDMLSGMDHGQALSLAPQERIEVFRRCVTMLEANSRRKELPSIEVLFRTLARCFRVTDIDIIEHILRTARPNVTAISARCGLPVAAFRVVGSSNDAVVSINPEAAVIKQFVMFDGSGRTRENDASLAQTLDLFETFTDPLVSTYARLLRKCRTLPSNATEQLSNVFEGRRIAEALVDICQSGQLERWVGGEPASPSFFVVVVRRTWALAIASRLTRHLNQNSQIPTAVAIASSLIDDEIVGELLRLALNRVETELTPSATGEPAA
jgi:hypothetical protein